MDERRKDGGREEEEVKGEREKKREIRDLCTSEKTSHVHT